MRFVKSHQNQILIIQQAFSRFLELKRTCPNTFENFYRLYRKIMIEKVITDLSVSHQSDFDLNSGRIDDSQEHARNSLSQKEAADNQRSLRLLDDIEQPQDIEAARGFGEQSRVGQSNNSTGFELHSETSQDAFSRETRNQQNDFYTATEEV
mmetsp:Transcript_33225/g.38159  ORF Transcript_33225/g.38159 Transcript_33225/m.38159 type:complete len:152 (-) Transcript_33225:515-970(-)